MEHEYEGVKNRLLPEHTFANFWNYHEEGSLKDNGAEYAFGTPLFGLDAINAIEWLVSHAKDSGWKCTKRTGIHVHLDVRDLIAAQLAGMCIIYGAAEPILYEWVGDGRDASHFCIPLFRADEALASTCTIIRSAIEDDKDDGHNTLQAAEAFQRYCGFNLQALHKFGSIEFRQLQTTHDIDRIKTWVNILMSLKRAAFKLPQSDGAVVRMIQRMGAREFLRYVFPENIAEQLYTNNSDELFFTRGLPTARDIAVHGCADTGWVTKNYPKCEHSGFSKWLKSQAKIPVPGAEPVQWMGDEDGAQEPPDFDEPPLQVRRHFELPQLNPELVAPAPEEAGQVVAANRWQAPQFNFEIIRGAAPNLAPQAPAQVRRNRPPRR